MAKTFRSRKNGTHYPLTKRKATVGTMSHGTAHLKIPKSVAAKIKNEVWMTGEHTTGVHAVPRLIW